MNKHDPAEVITSLLRGPESKRVMDKLGIDSSEVSRFLSGQRGFRIDQINDILEFGDYEIERRPRLRFLNEIAVSHLSQECARLAGR